MARDNTTTLAQQIFRVLTVFQALVISPVALLHGVFAFMSLLIPVTTWGEFWDLLQGIIVFLACTSIPIIVIFQWRNTFNSLTTLKLEACKSGLVTGVWVWWVVRLAQSELARRGALNGVAYAVVIVALFYPSLVNSYLRYRQDKKIEYENREGRIELDDYQDGRREEDDVLLGSVD